MQVIRGKDILSFAIVVYVFAYLGMFTRYRLIPTYAMIIIFLLCMTMGIIKTCFNCFSVMICLLLIYVLISAVFLNRKTGFQYIPFLIMGLLMVSAKAIDYGKIIRQIETVALVFSLYTIVNYFYHELTKKLFSFFLTEKQFYTIYLDFENGGVAGLAGEASFNAFCLSLGLIAVYSRIIERKVFRVSDGVKIIVLFLAVYMTGKRSVLLISFLLAVVALVLYLSIGITMTGKNIILAATVLAFFVLTGPLSIEVLVKRVFYKGGESIALSNREWFWNIALEMFRERPLFGQGINTYDFVYNIRKSSEGYVYFAGAHNSYLQYLAELGIAGLIILMMLIAVSFICAFRYIRINKNKIGFFSFLTMLLIVIYAMTENPFYQPQQIFMFFFAVSIVSQAYSAKNYLMEKTHD